MTSQEFREIVKQKRGRKNVTAELVPGCSGLNDVIDVSSDGGRERVTEFFHILVFLLLRALALKQNKEFSLKLQQEQQKRIL
jgi:hypothetical protein